MVAQLERQKSQAASFLFHSRMIAQLERQEKSSDRLSLLQRDDCITRKTRKVKRPALFYFRGMIASQKEEKCQATSSLLPSRLIAQLERQEKSSNQLFSLSAG